MSTLTHSKDGYFGIPSDEGLAETESRKVGKLTLYSERVAVCNTFVLAVLM